MNQISRKPKDYTLSIHAAQNAKWRDIPFEDIATSIEEGELEESSDTPGRYIFRHDGASCVVDPEAGEVVTVVEGRYDYTETKTARYGKRLSQ